MNKIVIVALGFVATLVNGRHKVGNIIDCREDCLDTFYQCRNFDAPDICK